MKKLFIISALTLALITTVFTSCADNTSSKTETVTSAVSETTEVGEETTTGELQPNLPDQKFGGTEIKFLTRGETFNEWKSQDIFAESQNGEPVNDAVYLRNVFIEDRYEVKIVERGQADPLDTAVKKSVQAGTNDYDIVMPNTSQIANLAAESYLYDLYDIPYIDFGQPWWDDRSVESLSIGNKLYFCTSDLSIMPNDATWILMFNKNLVEDYTLDVPYDLVNADKWTMDKMLDMMLVVASDLNGDGKMDDANDQFGFMTHGSSYEGFFFGSGSRVTNKDASDIPYIDMYSERLVGLVEKTNSIMMNKIATASLSLDPITKMQPVFQGNRSLFYGEVMQCIIRLRAMEVDFGVLPFPKYDELQEDYKHYVNTTAAMIGVPITNQDLEMTGIILEAMSAKSKYTLREAYYDTCLDGKFMRDEESRGMLDIILATRNYDIGYIYNWGSLYGTFSTAAGSGNTDIASKFAAAEEKALTAMEKTIDIWINGVA
jgi:hypothetical protein